MKRQTKSVLQGATILLGVVTFATTATAGDGDPPQRPKKKPTTFLSHTNQDQVPPPPPWTHTNQDEVPLPGDPPDPGLGDQDRHDAPPLVRDIIDPGWTWTEPTRVWLVEPFDPALASLDRDLLEGAQEPGVIGARPGVLSHDRLSALEPGPDAFLSARGLRRIDPQLRNPRGDAALFLDGATDALDLPLMPPSAPGTTRPFVQSPVPTPGALSLIGLGALALIGRRRRR